MSTRDALQIADRYDRAVEDLERDAIARLNTALDSVYTDLEKQLSQSYSGLQTQGGLVASQRRAIIFDELGELLQLKRPGQAERYEKIYNDLMQSASDSGSTMADELVAAIDSQWPIAQFARIPIEAVALQARDGTRRLSRHSEEFAGRASAIVEQGLIQGWGVRRVADNMRRELGITKGKAESIARTEVSSALNDAAEQRYKDNGLDYFQIIVTPSEGLCPFCAARNGKVYKVGKMRVPIHVRCRCMKIPWSKSWQEKGLTDDAFIKGYRDRNLAALRADGQKPNNGPTYWEKKAGLSRAPRAVWTPGSRPRKRKAKTPEPSPVPASTGTFPDNSDELTVVRQLGGSTGAELVQDANGNQFVRKRGSSPEHLREEFAADQAYQALGIAVPEARLYETNAGPVKLSRFIEGRPLSELTGRSREVAISAIQKDFAADALLGNWDVIGLAQDNILVDATGKVWRIDNGGALRYRAQGQLKANAWNGYPQEIWTLRDPGRNEQTASVFGGLKFKDVAFQLNDVYKQRDTLLAALPSELHEVINQRLGEFRNVAHTVGVMGQDKFKMSYLDTFTRHGIGIRAAGISDRMPSILAQTRKGSVTVVDENGKQFDDLRGQNSIVNDLAEYIESVGGNYSMVSHWMKKQAGDSWNPTPQAVKWYYSSRRSGDASNDYWWRNGRDEAKTKLNQWLSRIGSDVETLDTTFAAYHAFNLELMRNIDFTNNDRESESIRLVRTENKNVMQMNKLKQGDRNVTMKRGPVESTSVFRRIEVFGTEITIQKVPHHRILGTYFQARHPGGSSGAFLGDGENEFVAMLEGVPFDYEKTDTFTGTGNGPTPPKGKTSKKKSTQSIEDLVEDALGEDDPFGDVGDLEELFN